MLCCCHMIWLTGQLHEQISGCKIKWSVVCKCKLLTKLGNYRIWSRIHTHPPEGDSSEVWPTLEALCTVIIHRHTHTQLDTLQWNKAKESVRERRQRERTYLKVCFTALLRRSMILMRSSREQVSSSVRSWFRSNDVTLPNNSNSHTVLSALHTQSEMYQSEWHYI